MFDIGGWCNGVFLSFCFIVDKFSDGSFLGLYGLYMLEFGLSEFEGYGVLKVFVLIVLIWNFFGCDWILMVWYCVLFGNFENCWFIFGWWSDEGWGFGR